MKILMVLTSHDQLGNTGKKTGFWLEEFAAPYYVLKDAGALTCPQSILTRSSTLADMDPCGTGPTMQHRSR
jgi:hypothetical protein